MAKTKLILTFIFDEEERDSKAIDLYEHRYSMPDKWNAKLQEVEEWVTKHITSVVKEQMP